MPRPDPPPPLPTDFFFKIFFLQIFASEIAEEQPDRIKDILEARGTSEAVFKKHYRLSRPAATAARSNEVYGKRKSFHVTPVKAEPVEEEEESVTEEEEEKEETEKKDEEEEEEKKEESEDEEMVQPKPRSAMFSDEAFTRLLDACKGFGVNHDGSEPPQKRVKFME